MNTSLRAAGCRMLVVYCATALLVPIAVSFGQEWRDDIQYASCESGPGQDVSYNALELTDEMGAAAASDCQSCGCSPNSSFKSRLTAMAKCMAQQGVTYDAEATQFYQGVASGGQEQEFEYGGKVDQFVILDSGKLGLWQGMTTIMHVETRFGQDVNFEAVGLAPVNVAMLYPKFDEHVTAITGLTFAQALNEEVQVTFGKFNALDLFYSLYPQTGRGVNGFMNASMVIPLSVARVVPLSFIGAGVLRYQEKLPQSGLLVYDTHNVATTSGFDELGDNGANIMGFYRFFTNFGGLPGSHNFIGIWSTGEFVSFDPAGFVIEPGQGIVAVPRSGAYSLVYILEQKLWVDDCNKNRNIGLLSQWGLADEQTSPFSWSTNIGIQAQGLSRSRPLDTAGVGYFYSGLSDDFKNALAPVVNLHDVNGVELYYNAAVSECFQLTADLQVIEPAEIGNDTAIVFGLRGTLGM